VRAGAEPTVRTGFPGPDGAGAAARSARERDIASRFATAFAGNDIDGVVALLTDEQGHHARPHAGVKGPEAIAGFLRESRAGAVPALPADPEPGERPAAFGATAGSAGFGVPRARDDRLTLEGERISDVTRFVDNSTMARSGCADGSLSRRGLRTCEEARSRAPVPSRTHQSGW